MEAKNHCPVDRSDGRKTLIPLRWLELTGIITKMRDKSLSDEIRQAVRNSGRTNYSLAAEMGVSPSTLWRFSTGKGGLSLDLLDRLAEILDLHVIINTDKKGK